MILTKCALARARALAAARLGGGPLRHLDPDIAEITGMPGYRAAIRQGDSVLVQPAALLRGLSINLPSNVQIYENSPVKRIRTERSVQLDCPEGRIVAGTLLVTAGTSAEQDDQALSCGMKRGNAV